jgi:hypothetical protein
MEEFNLMVEMELGMGMTVELAVPSLPTVLDRKCY